MGCYTLRNCFKTLFSIFIGYFSDLKPELKVIASLLKRYIQSLVPCCKRLLEMGYQKVLRGEVSFDRVASSLSETVPGLILKEFLVLMTITQFFAPAMAIACEGVPLLGELLDHLNMFNRCCKKWEEQDRKDLAWSDNGELIR